MTNQLVEKIRSIRLPFFRFKQSEESKKTFWIWPLLILLGTGIVGVDVLLLHSTSRTASSMNYYQSSVTGELHALLENLSRIDTVLGDNRELISSSELSTSSSVEELSTHLTTLHEDVITTESEIQSLLTSISEAEYSSYEEYLEQFTTLQENVVTLDTNFQSILEETQNRLTELNSFSDNRQDNLITVLTTLQENLSTQETTLNTTVMDTLKTLEQDANTLLTNVHADITRQMDQSNTEMSEALETLSHEMASELDRTGDAMSAGFQSTSLALSGGFETLDTNLALYIQNLTETNETSNAELRSEIQSVYDYIDRSFTSVANGKQLVASALAAKNMNIADDATFQQIYEAILNIPQNLQAGSLTCVTTEYTYHHHTLGTRGDGDNNIVSGPYPDTYRSSVCGGCFTSPVYHVHTSSCYHTENHKGDFYWDGMNSDTDDGEVVGNWSTGGVVTCQCGATTYHVQSGWGPTSGGHTEVRWTSQEITCGKTTGTVEYYKKSCPLVEGQILKTVSTYYTY